MFIDVEPTPNPDTLKFVPEQPLLADSGANITSINFTGPAQATGSPLATALFALEGVAGVYIAADFLSVTRRADHDWDALKASIIETVQLFLSSGAPVLEDSRQLAAEIALEDDPADREIIAQIKSLLDDRVRPAVVGDGGDIVYRGFRQGTVYLEMQGACSGCPSATMTLRHGIENLLRYYVPEVTAVEPV